MMFSFLFIVLNLGCTKETPTTAKVIQTEASQDNKDLGLGFRPDLVVSLDLPEHNRPTLDAPPERWRVPHAWTELRADNDSVEYTTAKPYTLLRYGSNRGNKPKSMVIESESLGTFTFKKQRKRKPGKPQTWGIKGKKMVLRLPIGHTPPDDLWIRYPGATAEAVSRHLDTSGLDKKDFVFRTMKLEREMGHGLFLPAPATIQFRLEVPANGHFQTTAHLVQPAIKQKALSDGAHLTVSVTHGEETTELNASTLSAGEKATIRLDLSKWAGKSVKLAVQTGVKDNKIYDFVFLQDPVVYTPKQDPKRVVFTLVDTLRADHLGTYGYPRKTSPNIDQFAEQAVVFEQARAPAPWTLPSSLAALYGRTPEHVSGELHLGEILGQKGWATCAVISNGWLLGSGDLGAGWSSHRARRVAQASNQAKKGTACIHRYPDRNVLLFLHMIDPHTPYVEPSRFRNRFEQDTPTPFVNRSIGQKVVKRAVKKAANQAEKDTLIQYVVDRYDQNILAVDAAFSRVLKHVGPNAIVLLTSDHGEEFFEHGKYEHGRNLYDESLHVPLIVRAPGLEASRVAAPVTLMDIVPTLLSLLGEPALTPPSKGAIGSDLTPLAKREPNAEKPFIERPLALGRTLLSSNHWGVYLNGHKWVSTGPKQQLFNLTKDPNERTNIARRSGSQMDAYPKHLSAALRRPVQQVIRISGSGSRRSMPGESSRLEVHHPAGISNAWIGNDPRDYYPQTVIEDNRVIIPLVDGKRTPNEIFILLPKGTSPIGLTVTRSTKNDTISGTVSAEMDKKSRTNLLKVGDRKMGFVVDMSWQALPTETNGVVFTGEVNEDLKALGYMD